MPEAPNASLSRKELAEALRVAEAACDRARAEILPRFRRVDVETKADGSPVTEADRAAERAIREVLSEAFPEFGVLGEEYGAEGRTDGPRWVVDPIDGTIAFSRGLPLFSTIVALVEGDPDRPRSLLGVIDLPGLGERYTGHTGGGCFRNGEPTRVSQAGELSKALVSHGDPYCFAKAGADAAWQRLARECRMLRGYTDAFGHALVLGGGVDVMVDCDLNPWDASATEVLVAEAGGRCFARRREHGRKVDLVFGSPALVEILAEWL